MEIKNLRAIEDKLRAQAKESQENDKISQS